MGYMSRACFVQGCSLAGCVGVETVPWVPKGYSIEGWRRFLYRSDAGVFLVEECGILFILKTASSTASSQNVAGTQL